MKYAAIKAVLFLLAIHQGSANFQCPSATFVELGKDVRIDCLISDVNDIYWLRGTEEDHYPIVKIEMGLKTISKVAQDHFDITDTGALVIRDASNDLTGSYVMLHYRTDLVREVDTVTLNVTTLVDSIIIQGPSGGVYPMGSNITLTCTFQKGYVVGWKEYENKDIFVADTKVTADTKYDNFRVSLSDRISNLQIKGAELEDAGKYSCNTESYAHVEIEAPPSFSIMFNDTDDEGTDSTDSYDVIDITCIARNARPAVMIRFETDGSEWINPSETWTVSNGVTFDTYATLKYNFRKNQTDVFLTCQTFGQKTVPPIEKIIHLFTPTCSLEMSNTEATCSCISNPPVYKYILSIDGKLEVSKTLNVETLDGSNISCTGVNYIGVGISTSRVVESINVIIVVVILVAVIAFVVVYRWRKKHQSQANSKDTEHSESALPEENHLLSDDSNEKSEQNTKDLSEKGDGSPCADRKPMENSNVVSPDEEKLLAKTSKHKNNEKGSSERSGSSASEHNHERFKSTDTEHRNAQSDNHHGAEGTLTDSKHENKTKTCWFCPHRKSKPISHFTRAKGTSVCSESVFILQKFKRTTKQGTIKRSKFQGRNEKNGKNDELASLKGKHEKQKKEYQEAANKKSQHNAGQESKEELGKISSQKIAGEVKAMFESSQLQLQPNSGLHSKAQESEDSVKTSIPEAPKR